MIAISSKKHSTTAAVQNRGGTAPLRRGNGPGARYSSKIEGEWPQGPLEKQIMEYNASSIKGRGNGPTIRGNGPSPQYYY